METIAHSFIKAFGWSILHSFWQGALIYAILFALLYFLPKASSAIRHNLSFLSICLMFGWFIKTFVTHFEIPVSGVSTNAVSGISGYTFYYEPGGFISYAESVFPIIIYGYLIGFALQLFFITKGYLHLQKLRNTQQESVTEQWQQLFNKVTLDLNIKKKVAFKISNLVHSPLVIGYLKPIILFPVGFYSYLDQEQVEAILIHELSHIRRNDYVLNLIKTTIETLLFFNPFLWLAGRFIQIERENACDDKVLKTIQKPLCYANALLALEIESKRQTPQLTLAATGKTQYLFHRIKRITNMKTNYLNLKQQMAALIVAIAGLASIAWIKPFQEPKSETVKINAIPINRITNSDNQKVTEITYSADTIKPDKGKSKMKIMLTDNDGNVQEYHSLQELPDSIKWSKRGVQDKKYLSFEADSFNFQSFNSPEFKKKMNEIKKQFSSPEFKAKMEEVNKNFNSPEFKLKMQEIQKGFNSPEFKAKMEELNKNFNSPEFKKKMDEINLKLNSTEFKSRMDEIEKNFNSPEFKNKISDIQKELLLQEFKNKQQVVINDVKRNMKLMGDTILLKDGDNNYSIYMESLHKSNEEKELENNAKYQKLKKKFDKDVEKIRKQEDAKK